MKSNLTIFSLTFPLNVHQFFMCLTDHVVSLSLFFWSFSVITCTYFFPLVLMFRSIRSIFIYASFRRFKPPAAFTLSTSWTLAYRSPSDLDSDQTWFTFEKQYRMLTSTSKKRYYLIKCSGQSSSFLRKIHIRERRCE